MRRRFLILAGICVMGFCVGCGEKDDAVQGQDISEMRDEAETDNEDIDAEKVWADGDDGQADGEEEPVNEDDEKQADAAAESGEASAADAGQPDEMESDIPGSGRNLTREELAAYTEWIQDASNYGFLLSEWENPTQIDLYQVFYTGAGIARQGTEEEKQAFLKRYDQPEIYTDFQAMDKADVSALLLEKVGLTYDELVAKGSKGMEETYYAETDSFCSEHGDTNYIPFICTDGVVNEEGTIVTLYCDGDDWVRTCEVKVSIASEQKHLLSNHIVEGMLLDMEAFSEGRKEE